MIKFMFSKVASKTKQLATTVEKRIESHGKVKYFCIGRNKTGTTSLRAAFEMLSYPVGNQRTAEILTDKYYFAGDFDPIVEYCKSARVFQDVPFSYPETYRHLDRAYPGSKFILTVRDDAEQWYRSITRFHAKMFGRDGRTPTAEDLKAAQYLRPGFMYNVVRLHGTTDEDPYNKDAMIAHYERHNREIKEYFEGRSEDLLVINVAEQGAYRRFIDFLEVASPYDDFPWENKT
jgi:hypothetical protein